MFHNSPCPPPHFNFSLKVQNCEHSCDHRWLMLLSERSTPPSCISRVDCGSAWSVTWWKKAWMRACRAPSAHQANVSIREYKKGGGAPNPHLAPITVSCPSPRPISSHYRPMWIPGKFLRPNFFRPIDSIWPGSFDVLSVNIMVIGYYHPHSTVAFIYVRMTDEAAFDMNQLIKRFHIHYYILDFTYNDLI